MTKNAETAVSLLVELEAVAKTGNFAEIAKLLKRTMQPFGETDGDNVDVFTIEDVELLKEFWRIMLDPPCDEELLPRAIFVYIYILGASVDREFLPLQSTAKGLCDSIITVCSELAPEEDRVLSAKVLQFTRT